MRKPAEGIWISKLFNHYKTIKMKIRVKAKPTYCVIVDCGINPATGRYIIGFLNVDTKEFYHWYYDTTFLMDTTFQNRLKATLQGASGQGVKYVVSDCSISKLPAFAGLLKELQLEQITVRGPFASAIEKHMKAAFDSDDNLPF